MPETEAPSGAVADTTVTDGPATPDPSPEASPDTGETDWKALAEQAQADAAKWKAQSRKHEDRARTNAEAATKAKTVEQQLDDLRKAMAERDVADVARAGRLALTQVHARLAEAGLARGDVDGLLELVDPMSLLADGEPDDKAIDKLAKSLSRIAGRTTPDRDQGRGRGSGGPVDMNTLIRRQAGVIT